MDTENSTVNELRQFESILFFLKKNLHQSFSVEELYQRILEIDEKAGDPLFGFKDKDEFVFLLELLNMERLIHVSSEDGIDIIKGISGDGLKVLRESDTYWHRYRVKRKEQIVCNCRSNENNESGIS